jgi:crotonobetainyl-CoA:carnitine CoA-transferase CaiB-like acyl-CoA transferase
VRQAARWTVGADTDDVLRELGYDTDELRQLHDDDVI